MLIDTTTHGHSRRGAWSPTYYAWAGMIQRCTNPARNVWRLYGGRGIRVCDRWRVFENFLADMGERPAGCSIGRIDPDGHYEPANCAWQSAKEQSRTRRNVKLSPVAAEEIRALRAAGETYPQIGRRFGISKTMARNVALGRAWS